MSGRGNRSLLNRKATASEGMCALQVARRVAAQYERRGAVAVLLAGSWARGDAHRWSDVDVWVLGRRAAHRLRPRNGFIVSIKETTARAQLLELRDPALLGQAVLAWREAVVLYDPGGVAARIQASARAFRWRSVGPRCDRFVARSIAEWGEEVFKLSRHLTNGSWESAAVQRDLLSNGLAGLMAIHLRMLYDENELWETVGTRMGREWHRTQKIALAVTATSLRRSCHASVKLYVLSARAVKRTLRGADREVVARVCERAGFRF